MAGRARLRWRAAWTLVAMAGALVLAGLAQAAWGPWGAARACQRWGDDHGLTRVELLVPRKGDNCRGVGPGGQVVHHRARTRPAGVALLYGSVVVAAGMVLLAVRLPPPHGIPRSGHGR